MKLQVGDKTFTVDFDYDYAPYRVTHKMSGAVFESKPVGTVCTITDPEGNIFMSGATCHERDTFKKATGRKIALARTLQAMKMDKIQRELFWNKFFEKVSK